MVYILFLVAIELILFLTNYQAGTYLIGWDNIMPEFNILLNLKRSLFSVWQDYRGLGLLDGMAQAANLMHTIYIFILSTFLPQNLLRYSFITLTHLAGGIAFFVLVKSLLDDREKGEAATHEANAEENKAASYKPIAFVAALFYMFNLGVIQMFYVPLEVFTIHFAALPALALATKNVLKQANPKNVFILFAAAFLVSPQGFVPTVFAAFLVLFSALLLFDFIQHKDFKKIIIVAFVVIAANAFWILPYFASAIKTSKIITNARINQFSSEEVFLRNKARGDALSVLEMKGFVFDSVEYDNNQSKNFPLMRQWREYYNNILVRLSVWVFIFTALLCLAYAIFTKRQLLTYTLAFSFFFLASRPPGVSQLNYFLKNVFPPVGEALRFSFTKFIILFAFCFSIFLAFGISLLSKLFSKKIRYKQTIASLITACLFGFLLLVTALPAFRGYFFSPLLK